MIIIYYNFLKELFPDHNVYTLWISIFCFFWVWLLDRIFDNPIENGKDSQKKKDKDNQ